MAAALLPDDPHDRRLLDHVRPPGWTNPTPKPRYDLVVLGAGAGGLVCAAGAAGLGARVALVEKHLLGGECLTDGCVPSKALLRAARAAADARRAGRFGVRVGDVNVDFPAVMGRLRRLRADLAPNDSAERLRSLGVDVFLGEGKFTGPDAVEVGGARLAFRKAVIATGSRTAVPDVPGLRDTPFLTNETAFALTELPGRLAVLGAGAVGCEMAQAFARFGSRVTLLARGGRVMSREDPEAAKIVAAALAADGVNIVGEPVERIDPGTVHHAGGSVAFDRLLVATGRAPTVAGLGLETAGVAFDPKVGVQVDDRLRTTNRRVFAVGDVATALRFTHVADAMARLVIRNALFKGRGRFSRIVLPRCTYTDPELARVGLTEDRAREAGVAVRAFTVPFADVDRAVLEGETDGFVKVLVRAGTDRIVGATVVGPRAGELIGELGLAMTAGAGLRRLAGTVHPYPTSGEALRKAGDAYNRSRLTPFTRRILRWWMQL